MAEKGELSISRKMSKQKDYEDMDTTPQKSKPNIHEVRAKIVDFLEHNQKFHLAITALVFLDVTVIITQLILEATDEKPHCGIVECVRCINETLMPDLIQGKNHDDFIYAENIIHYVSIAILATFMVEIIVKIFAFGLSFIKHKLETFDAIVVTVAFFLDVLLSKQAARDAVGLLVLLRLWRVLHITTSIVETMNMKAMEREKKLRAKIAALEKENELFKDPQKIQTDVHDPKDVAMVICNSVEDGQN